MSGWYRWSPHSAHILPLSWNQGSASHLTKIRWAKIEAPSKNHQNGPHLLGRKLTKISTSAACWHTDASTGPGDIGRNSMACVDTCFLQKGNKTGESMVEVIRSTIINHSFYRFQMISDGNWMNWRRFPGERIAAWLLQSAPLGDTSPWLRFSHSFLKLWTGSPRKWRNRCISQLLQGHQKFVQIISQCILTSQREKNKTNLWNAGCCFQQDFRGSNLSNLSGSKNWLVLSYLKESAQNCTPTQDEERRRATISCSKWILDEGWSLNHLMSKYIQIQRFLNIQPWYLSFFPQKLESKIMTLTFRKSHGLLENHPFLRWFSRL